jgi:hypothetical protein
MTNSKPVSQLAGDISDKIADELPFFFTAETEEQMTAIISAALSEREEKVAKLIKAVEDDLCSVPCGEMCCGNLRAALQEME